MDFELDLNNKDFYNAADIVTGTNENLFLTGKAGTGKTTFVEYIKKKCRKNIVVVAPTGVAAINVGGVTIHSFFQIPPRKDIFQKEDFTQIIYNYNKLKIELINTMDVLVIDEISMVRSNILEMIDRILKHYRGYKYRKYRGKTYQMQSSFDDEKKPFGGVQVVLVGDPFQLPPINRGEIISGDPKTIQWDNFIGEYKVSETLGAMFFNRREFEISLKNPFSLGQRRGKKPITAHPLKNPLAI